MKTDKGSNIVMFEMRYSVSQSKTKYEPKLYSLIKF